MILLAVDTSSPALSVALRKNKEEILERSVQEFPAHAENLMPFIAALLKKKKLRIQDVDVFLIDRGPGSFTGLRIGFATLKGFLAIDKKKCCGALSLDLISENARINKNTPSPAQSFRGQRPRNPETTGSLGASSKLLEMTTNRCRPKELNPWLAVCLDARREKIYFRLYRRRKENWIPFQKPQTVSFQELKKILPENTLITGDALVKYRELFDTEMHSKNLEYLPEKFWYPKASALITFFLNKDPRLVPLKTPKDFLPLYFRLSEAEERRKEYAHAH